VIKIPNDLSNMKQVELLKASEMQLARVLSFFRRVETKASIILGINTGMLAIITPKFSAFTNFENWMIIIFSPIFLNGISLWCLYQSSSPQLKGGHDSLIYFKQVAKLTENKYIEKFSKQAISNHIKDVLSQVWRNSEILKEKFKYVKYSYIFLSIAIVPWVLSLILFNL